MPPSSQSPNILCVDDEPNALIIRKLLLQRAGYTVFAALNCETALLKCPHLQYQLRC